jgi:hypothetical protein
VEASAARQDVTSGQAKLRIVRNLLFNDRNCAVFLSQHKLESLELSNVDLDSEVTYRAIVTAGIRCLTLQHCDLEDEEAALVESVKDGSGPKELYFWGIPFGPRESLTFMNALRGDEHLERLHVSISDDRQVTQALAAALHGNKGLVHLTVSFDAFDESDVTELLGAISVHPSLRSLDLKTSGWFGFIDPEKRRGCTKAVGWCLFIPIRSIKTTGMHSLSQGLNVINIGSCFL